MSLSWPNPVECESSSFDCSSLALHCPDGLWQMQKKKDVSQTGGAGGACCCSVYPRTGERGGHELGSFMPWSGRVERKCEGERCTDDLCGVTESRLHQIVVGGDPVTLMLPVIKCSLLCSGRS